MIILTQLVLLATVADADQLQERTEPDQSVAVAKDLSPVVEMMVTPDMRSWAKCSWRKMPVTSENLTKMYMAPPEEWTAYSKSIPLVTTVRSMRERLNAFCAGELLVKNLRNRSYTTGNALIHALIAEMPKVVDGPDKPLSIILCAYKFQGRFGVGQYFVGDNAVEIKLKTRGEESCFRVKADGSLSDA